MRVTNSKKILGNVSSANLVVVRLLLVLLPHLLDNGRPFFSQRDPGPKPSHHFDKRECEEQPVVEVIGARSGALVRGAWASCRGGGRRREERRGRAEGVGVEDEEHGEEEAERSCWRFND
jgi:hypothetical protein